MGKKIKKCKSKLKSLVEKLHAPRIVRPNWKHYVIIGAFAVGSVSGMYSSANYLLNQPQKTEKQRLEQVIEGQKRLIQDQKQLIEDQKKIINDQKQLIKIGELADEDKEVFKYFQTGFGITIHYAVNQEGKHIKITSLLKESIKGKEAKKYAEELAKKSRIKNKGNEFKTLESKINLAKSLIDEVRTSLQERSTYSLAYEYQKGFSVDDLLAMEEEMNKTKCTNDQEDCLKYRQMLEDTLQVGDSVQTHDQFCELKNGKKCVGDCDDYSMSLITIYYAVKDYAEANKDRRRFYKSLAEGLDYYRIYSIAIPGHRLNLSATIKDELHFEVIEPQNKSKKHDIYFRTVTDKEGNGIGRVFIKYKENGKDVEEKIVRLFNRDFYAHAKQ